VTESQPAGRDQDLLVQRIARALRGAGIAVMLLMPGEDPNLLFDPRRVREN
jgi:hypothetical protein